MVNFVKQYNESIITYAIFHRVNATRIYKHNSKHLDFIMLLTLLYSILAYIPSSRILQAS